MGDWLADLRYSFRLLRKTPGTTLFIVLTLACAIGANTALFGVWNALVLRPIPAFEPDRLIAIRTAAFDTSGDDRMPLPLFEQLNIPHRTLSDLFAWRGDYPLVAMETGGAVFAGLYAEVSGRYFEALGVAPLLGRLITPEDAGREVAVLDYRCWTHRFKRNRAVLGKSIRAGRRLLTIVGVTPERFTGMMIEVVPDVTAPLQAVAASVAVAGRLKPGATVQAAEDEIRSLWSRISSPEFRDRRIRVESVGRGVSFLRERRSRPLAALMVLCGVLLLLACANLANIMLARSAARRYEVQVRIALGSTRWRLLRLALADILLVAIAGAALGIMFAYWAGPRLFQLAWTGYTPSIVDARPDARVLAFAVTLAVGTVVLVGLAPSRANITLAGRRGHSGAGRIGRLLIGVQVALSIVLVAGSTLLVRTLDNLRNADLGFRRDRLLMMRLFPRDPRISFPDRAAYYRELATRLSGLPGVEHVSFSGMGPISLGESPALIGRAGTEPQTACVLDQVGPGFFLTMGMRVLAGREFDWRDVEGAPPVAVISRGLAARFFPGEDPVGRHIDFGGRDRRQNVLVVGVVNDARLWKARGPEPLAAYVAVMQEPAYNQFWVDISTAGDARALASAARQTLESMGRHFPLRVETLRQHEDNVWAAERMLSSLSWPLAVLALLLACAGVYGVASYRVARRTSEIGVRMALGATPRHAAGLVLGETARIAMAGVAAGIPAALVASRLLAEFIYGLSPRDPATLVSASALLLTVALASAWLPARRAARVDPAIALRTE
jgi:predicted permease